MSYEIHIIAIKQKVPMHLPPMNKVLLHNEKEHYEVHRYAEIWPLFSKTEGILYSIVEDTEDGYYSSFGLCDSDFENPVPSYLLPTWLTNNAKENLTPFLIRESVKEEVISIIQSVLKASPLRKILFQTRYQGGDEEIILGVIKMSKFLDMLNKKEILFNVCYILEDD